MDQKAPTTIFPLTLHKRDKILLTQLAEERGGTMSGVLRRLIRDAAARELDSHHETRREAAASTR